MDTWGDFVATAQNKRLDCVRFERFANYLHNKHPLPASLVADLFLRPTGHDRDCLDPLIPQYIPILLQNAITEIPSILNALLRYSTFRPVEASTQDGAKQQKETLRWPNSYSQEESIFYGLSKFVAGGANPKVGREAESTLAAVTEWTKLLTVTGAADEMIGASGGIQDQEAIAVRVALGALLVALSESNSVITTLRKQCSRDAIKAYSESLAAFAPLLLNTSPILAERLEHFRTQVLGPLEPVDKKLQAANDELNKILDSTIGAESLAVVDLPIVNSRAGLYIYLNSLLVGRPMVDDGAILNYLHNRFQGDIQTTCIELITSSFDILANATFRNESPQTTLVLRSFLINKIPLLISVLSTSMFPPLTPEFCITEALSHVDTNAFPTFSSMFDESSSGNIFSDSVRQDFCFACCLHGLIAEESIEKLLGEIPMQTLPAGGRYAKDDLVQQCLSDPERTDALIEELENMDGNVGAVSQAITEVIGRLCESKETMSLKTLCSHLARKPSSLDVMLLFDRPSTILQPICDLLENWKYEEDQGEYQPVYEEFGSILLLVLAFVYRYDLSTVDLGLQSNDSFVGKLMARGAGSKALDELTDQEKNQLDGWIRGLFNSEGGGLGDEPMSACTPQEFYLLVPTLFHQVLLATNMGFLGEESLKSGLEFLVDTFLLPSLVGALFWLSNHLWQTRADAARGDVGDAGVVIQFLEIILRPGSDSTDASTMLSSILNITAKRLEHSLRWLQRSDPSRQDIEPLSKVLKPHLSFSRTAGSDHTELEAWSSSQNGGLASSIRHTIALLVQWSLTPGLNVMPTSYTHRQILVGIRMLGAKRLLSAVVDEVKLQIANGNSAVVLDVAASIICAPDAHSGSVALLTNALHDMNTNPAPLQHRLTLREALQTEFDKATKVHKEDVLQAETIVRLHRRVEAQVTVPVPLQLPQQTNLLHDGLTGLGDGALEIGVDGVLSGAQHLDDAIIAAADRDMMDALNIKDDGMMNFGDDDLMGDMRLDFE